MTNIFEAYLADTPGLRPFYAARPNDVFHLTDPPAQWNDLVHNCLQQQPLSTIALPKSAWFIATGQQAGLFTGPLYTIYKAITAIQVAQRIQERTGFPCIPLFWLSTEDHDFEEACITYGLAKDQKILTFRYDIQENIDGFPMYRVPLEPSLHGTIDTMAAHMPGSEYSGQIQALLHDTLAQSLSLADWCAMLLAELFRQTPLVILKPHLHEIRQAAAPILEREIKEPLMSTRLLNEAGQALQRLGYAPQIVKSPQECNFFLEMGPRRRKVLFENGRFVLPQENLVCSQEDMLALLAAAPERFSPNVALRCIAQQALLPVAAYVAGPGETAYWAQLKPLFEHFALPMPVVYPRIRCTLTNTKLNKLLKKYALSLKDLEQPHETLLQTALRQTADSPIITLVSQYRAQYASLAGKFLAEATPYATKNPEILDLLRAVSTQTDTGMDRIERCVLRADQARTETIRQHIHRLCNALMPERKPQERVFSAFSFLFEQGTELIPRLIQSLNAEHYAMQEVEL